MYHHERMCSVHLWSQYNVDLWPQGQIHRVYNMFSCLAYNYLLIWHWLSIFGTCVYHYERMSRVHLLSRIDIDIWPQGGIYRFLSILCVQTATFGGFRHWHTIFGKMGLSPWEHVLRTFTILIWRWLLTSRSTLHGFVFGPHFFPFTQSYYVWHVSVSPWFNVPHIFMTSVWPWPMTSISKLYFSPWIWVGLDRLWSLP